ncbi:MAG: hypothetical protein C0606_03420 [Hyphomicrobiales bacterium]|nr:MAG: hypothetical protein C0606_03420 [Hyphomicrobiales bacterium]
MLLAVINHACIGVLAAVELGTALLNQQTDTADSRTGCVTQHDALPLPIKLVAMHECLIAQGGDAEGETLLSAIADNSIQPLRMVPIKLLIFAVRAFCIPDKCVC